MLISGVQSSAAGIMFVLQSSAPEPPRITVIAPHAAFGAFYFLLAAIWLTIREARMRRRWSGRQACQFCDSGTPK